VSATEPTARNGEGEFVLLSNSPIYVDSMNRDDGHTPAGRNSRWANLQLSAGVFFAVLAVYVLVNPGRIDLIDGQVRYEVTMNWLMMGRPIVMDPGLVRLMGAPQPNWSTYSYYGAGASVAAMPLVWLGTFYDDPPGEATRFMFSLTTCIFGALAAGILYLFYAELGVPAKKALAWTGVAAFTTLLWPASDTTFDNAQHACLVLVAVFLGFVSSKRRSAHFAVLGGLVAGLLLTYQEYFALIIPLLAFSTFDSTFWVRDGRRGRVQMLLRPFWLLLKLDVRGAIREFKSPSGLSPEEVSAFHHARWRFGLFLLASLVGLAMALGYNYLRFGSVLDSGKFRHEAHRDYPLFGNPLSGLLTLLVSPGKSILFYSPPIVLGFAGIRRLWRHKPQVAFSVVAASAVLVLFISTISFPGGDWCWGPRYLTPLVPLWALSFPFVAIRSGFKRGLMTGIVALGLIVQCLAVSVENQRFFFERGLADFFWAKDPWFYFKHSALLARPGEALALIKGPPAEASLFNTYDNPPTYTTLGPPRSVPRSQAPSWMRRFKVFYVPRPWPFWMWTIPPDQRAISMNAWLAGLFGVALLGFALLRRGFHELAANSSPEHIPTEKRMTYAGQ
jgi:hypothetical protein